MSETRAQCVRLGVSALDTVGNFCVIENTGTYILFAMNMVI